MVWSGCSGTRVFEFDHHLFLNNDSQKTAPKFLDDFDPISEWVSFLRSSLSPCKSCAS